MKTIIKRVVIFAYGWHLLHKSAVAWIFRKFGLGSA